MFSKVSVTHQVDDLPLAAQALADGINGGMPLAQNSIGLLMCYSDMELAPFVTELNKRIPFDVIGCTCIAAMDNAEGFHEIAASLLVLSADDCQFAATISAPIVPGYAEAAVAKAYADIANALPGPAKLLYAIPPYNLSISLDEFTDAFNRVAQGVPVIGGLPSYNGSGDANMTIYNDRATEDCLVLLGISGNLHPVFGVQNVVGSTVERKRKVTAAKDNTVYRVGAQTFVDYMREINFPVDGLTGTNDTITFVSNPILLENVKLGDGEDFSFVRTLHKLDTAEGSGTAIGRIPMDATLSICSLEKGDIETAAGIGMRDLKEKMAQVEKEGYTFSTILAVSCIGRYLLMLPNSGTETEKLLAEMPPNITFAGFYGYGEIGPLPLNKAEMINFAHNESLVLCAF